MDINLDLNKQKYEVFKTNAESRFLTLKNKNFIFGKNGAGKSTICKMVKEQFRESHNVQIFSGFENITKNDKLNALLLGNENIEIQKKLKPLEDELKALNLDKLKLEKEIKSLTWDDTYSSLGIRKHRLYQEMEVAKLRFTTSEQEIDNFFIKKASKLKGYRTPHVTKPSYNKNDFSRDIVDCKILNEIEIAKYSSILMESSKEKLEKGPAIEDIDLENLTNQVNEILNYKIQEVTFVEEIGDDSDRKQFAEQGLKLHKIGENCSFCGSEVKADRISELKAFISISDIQQLEEKIFKQITIIENHIQQVKEIVELDKDDFYNNFHEDVDGINISIRQSKEKYQIYLKKLVDKLNEKNKSIFKKNTEVAKENLIYFQEINIKMNNLIDKQNEWNDNIKLKQNEARDALRLHYVAEALLEKESYKENWKGFEIENYELMDSKNKYESLLKKISEEIKKIKGNKSHPEENTLYYFTNQIRKSESEKSKLLQQTKNTHQLAININKKLERSGKRNLELTLVKDINGMEHYVIKDNSGLIRPIEEVSTGEKNIIAFLYFMESLSDLEQKNDKKKIILFDDPMNSNDDTMQYLITTEIHKLYTDKYRDKFNSQKDYFVCLTHNAHFYLNVQPHGYFKEKKLVDGEIKEVSKYNKNNFYRIEEQQFTLITSPKDDFTTHYDSLWFELAELFRNDLLNSILNSMRRIIETYTKFNKIDIIRFYQDREEHKKIFDVNSHSIDDHCMEIIGKDKEELLFMFKEVFEYNNAIVHFNTYWKQ